MTTDTVYVDNELFLGRLDEQDRFRDVLRAVLTQKDDDAPPFIFLLHGIGGIGKSRLAHRLCDLAQIEAAFESCFHVLCVDWELARYNTLALQVARDRVRPEDVFDALHRAALDAGWGRCFADYQKTVAQCQEAEREIARAVDQLTGESAYAALRDLGAAGLAKLVRLSLPHVGQTGEDLTQKLLAAGIQAGAEQLAGLHRQAEGFLRARLKPELYDVYRQPHERQARALAAGLRRLSRDRPFVLLLDTYELVAAADAWLRPAIHAAGPRVVWLIAGRDNLADSRAAGRYVGYRAEFARNLTVWDVGELAVEHVRQYLAGRAPGRPATAEDAAAVHRATLGVPLALSLAADLWADGAPLSAIAGDAPDRAPRETIVRRMCDRLLLHVEKDAAGRADRRALYALAMQPRPDDAVLAAVLRPPATNGDAGRAFDLGDCLDGLAGRHSAVRREGGARLHDAVAAFLGEYLLTTEARLGEMVPDVAGRAVAALRARRAALEADRPTLAERVESDDWRQATLDLAHWLFWTDKRAAWGELLPRFVEGLGYGLALARGLLDVAAAFRPALSQDGQKQLDRLALDDENRQSLLDELERLAGRGWLDDEPAAFAAERRTILYLWRGRWLAGQGRRDDALRGYVEIERRLPPEASKLRAQLGQAFYDLSGRFLWPAEEGGAVASEPGLQAAQRAAALDPQHAGAWHNLGAAGLELSRYDEALDACRRAIALDPQGAAATWNILGNVYVDLGRYDEALDAYRRAIELDPQDAAYPWNGLGNVYADLGRHDEAMEAYRRAIELDPQDAAYPWNGLGNVYRALGRCDEALDAYRRAIELDPQDADSYSMLGALYELQGRLEDALDAHRRAVELAPDDGTGHASLASVLRKLGREEEAAAHLARARALTAADDHYNLACLEAIAGDADAALEHLAQALAQSPGQRDWARHDPDLAALHGCLRFEELVGRPSPPG